MPTSARVPANSNDRERNCGLFLDVQTEMEHTPPLPLWCGGAARLWVFFTQREEEGSSGTGSTGRFPWWEALLACHRFTEERRKKTTQWTLPRRSPHCPSEIREPAAIILVFALRICGHSASRNETLIASLKFTARFVKVVCLLLKHTVLTRAFFSLFEGTFFCGRHPTN